MIGTFIAWEPAKHKIKNPPGYIVAENGCHLWVGAKTNGYGTVHVGPKRNGTGQVHRIRYEQEIGHIPEGMELDHFACNNRGCCNPLHVRPVTHRENVLRGESPVAYLLKRTYCPNGHTLVPKPATRGGRWCPICRNDYRKTPEARVKQATRMRAYRARLKESQNGEV